MSAAGKRASQGFDYQDIIVVYWLIQLLHDDNLETVQMEIMALPNESKAVTVDDIVLTFKDESITFIQAKKNQPKYTEWTFSDKTLRNELVKFRQQLEQTPSSTVTFYSRSPFGELQKLAEGCEKLYNTYSVFTEQAPATLKDPLKKLAGIFKRTEKQSYELVKRIGFGGYHNLDEWENLNRQLIENRVTQPDTALAVLFNFIRAYKTGSGSKILISGHDIEQEFQQHGLILAPKYTEVEVLSEFEQVSQIGRNCLRSIANTKLVRAEQQQIITLLEQNSSSILVKDKPGSGKTCLLLDLADYIELSTDWTLLFIKGDWFSEEGVTAKEIPEDVIGKCARLANYRKVVVIIDSLDVLALNREHKALKFFLSLIVSLEKINNISVLAACRSFDLKYDPLLRNTNWAAEISLADFDFETEVLPFLQNWNISASSLTEDLKNLLCIPQNLRLFELIVGKISFEEINTSFQLQESVIEEVICKDGKLGELGLQALQQMANSCVEKRSQDMPKLQFSADQSILQRLISQDILQDRDKNIAFTHQTLLDALMIRCAISNGHSLQDFTLSFLPLPFIRPFVRSYFFYLRVHTPEQFSRQVREFLNNNMVAYHLKRLVIESLAEITPEPKDWPLLRWLFNKQPDLFQRFFLCTQQPYWFAFFSENWLPLVLDNSENEIWRSKFIQKIEIWINIFPVQVIEYYLEALQKNWAEHGNILWTFSIALSKFEHWDTPKVIDILTISLHENFDKHFLGESISRYVDATNQGDELLWQYITKDIQLDKLENSYRFPEGLHCRTDDFFKKDFFQERLYQSETLLDLLLTDLRQWSGFIYGDFLNESSWRITHNKTDIISSDGINSLLSALEYTLKKHAKNNTAWWNKNEPLLRKSEDEAIIHFLIGSYIESVSDNLQGIDAILKNTQIFCWGHLSYELGLLIKASYPEINGEAQENNQNMILGLYKDQPQEDWMPHVIYKYLIWTPIIYRTLETQQFLEKWQGDFEVGLPQPDIRMRGGIVRSPISYTDLVTLTDESLIRFLKFYNDYNEWDYGFDISFVGGRRQVAQILGDCCSRNPQKYLGLLPLFFREKLHSDYIISLLKNIASHLDYRFGELSPNNNWQAVEPLPDGDKLAKKLLFIAQRYPPLWQRGHDISKVLEACCELLIDSESVSDLTILLFKLSNDKDPNNNSCAENLSMTALNSVRGVAAKSAMKLFKNLIEKGIDPPELLFYLLKRFARDENNGVKVSIIRYLPYVLYKKPQLGWQLFGDVFEEPQGALWKEASYCFYYQYYSNFDRVKPYLDKLLNEAQSEAGNVWSHISTLAYLSGYITEDELFTTLEYLNLNEAWKSAIDVFAANIDKKEHCKICEGAFIRIVGLPMLSKESLRQIDFLFGEKQKYQQFISKKLAITFIKAIQDDEEQSVTYFFDWLAYISIKDPETALELCEQLIKKLNSLKTPCRMWHTESLVSTLDNILKEVDESNDIELIHRAIALQDGFLGLEIRGIDEFINEI